MATVTVSNRVLVIVKKFSFRVYRIEIVNFLLHVAPMYPYLFT